MAKRFTDTNKYKTPFIRGLQGAYKVLWDYLYHDCDHAGIWIVDFIIAQVYVGSDLPIDKDEALRVFNDGQIRIIEIDNKKRWFFPGFIEFQYGALKVENRAHKSVIDILSKYKLKIDNKGLVRPLQGCKDKDKDLDMDMDKDKVITLKKSKESVSKFISHLNGKHHHLSDEEFRGLFISHCLEKQTTVSERAIVMRLRSLDDFNLDWCKSRLRQAIENGWKGLVFDDDKNGNSKPQEKKFTF